MTTALKKYARLEASALWRAHPDDQRKEVIISIGDATLMISDMRDQAITHWSLAVVKRANPGKGHSATSARTALAIGQIR